MNHVDSINPEQKKRDRLEILVQQVDNLVTKSGGLKTVDIGVPYSKLYCFATTGERFLQIIGWIAACLAGFGMPAFVLFMGDILDAYNPFVSPEEMLDLIEETCLIMVIVGAGIFLFTYVYYACLLIFSERIANKTRIRYLQAILEQESAWYDLTSPQELSSRLRKEVVAISQALGEKMGTIMMAFAMSIAGFAFAFIYGWSYSLVVMATFPFMLISTQLLTTVMQGGFTSNLKAYGQSAGYAEQALNAIRVVVAFGQEERESITYTRFLTQAKTTGIKTTCKTSIILAMFMFISLISYAYSFFMGSIWIYYEIPNHFSGEDYTAGDVLTCFFGVLFGLYSMGMAAPNIKAVASGKVAGKMVYDIIDRVPSILVDDKKAVYHNVNGQIELKNVTFVYPSRPDQKVLDDFTIEFEVGKTTAIVGPSGSGKSTIVQLLERFYDPRDGQVLIDGHDLKNINLKNYRQQIGYVGQEPILFNTTIKKNILFGNPNATDDEIIEALKSANAYDFVMSHEEGIELNVGQSGGQLSGGQKQRIAIARAFIKKPKVLIFDEATSALDTKNEKEVQRAIDQIKNQLGQVTTIVIAHRLTTIQNADTILVLKKGKLTEKGNHHQLLREHPNGIYAKLVKQQDNQPEDDESSPEKKPEKFEVNPISYEKQASHGPEDHIPVMTKQLSKKHHHDHAEEKQMKELIDQKDKEEDDADAEDFKAIEKTSFFKRLSPYNKPCINVFIGILLSIINGGVFPVFGLFMTKCLFALMIEDDDQMLEESWGWSLYMFLTSLVSLICIFFVRFLFGIVGENITLNVRSKMYFCILKNSISWFDQKENAPGVLTTVLSNDASVLQGASSEGLGIILESLLGIVVGLTLAFYYSWRLTLVSLGTLPFMMVGGALNAKFQAGFSSHDEQAYKDADMLSGDAIMNQRTVTCFGHDEIVIDQFQEYLSGPHKKAKNAAHLIGFLFGVNQLIQYGVFSLIFWAGTKFIFNDTTGSINQLDTMTATFVIMFAAFGAGQAGQYGPDMGKAKKAAVKIFGYIDKPSKINGVDIPNEAVPVPENLKGEIEFRNVWFRYPSRKNEWVFKGLNLKINPNQSVAIVGESGCGKSTLVNLVLRFYDPCHGDVLIDGVNIKDYNLRELRQRMGMVMQEPTLFNYTIKENILYGKTLAQDSEVRAAAEIANALEFIESQELFESVEDNAIALLAVFKDRRDDFVWLMGEEKYQEKIKELEFLEKKEKTEGAFKVEAGIIDERPDHLKNISMHSGFDINCGLRGGKLSGGQKQRIAIARAVIRKPQILILDEATSALDEDSQKKVQKALENIMDDRTSIVIAHRLTTVEKCKRIVVLENGKVIEDGTVDQLKSASDGHFAKLQQSMAKQEKKESRLSKGMTMKEH